MKRRNRRLLEALENYARKLSIFDFDDTLVATKANVYITHADGVEEVLSPAEYAIYDPQEGDEFDFGEFEGKLKAPEIIKRNFDLLAQVLDKSSKDRRTAILTARSNAKPIQDFFDEKQIGNVEIVALGSSDPLDKANWIEDQVENGWNDIRFMDDSAKNVSAVREMAKKYPEVEWLIRKVRIH